VLVPVQPPALIGDVQTKNANLTKNIYNQWTHRFLTVDTVLAPATKCVDMRMNLCVVEKTKKYAPVSLLDHRQIKRIFSITSV
jgi:hypothetical protein